MTNHHVQNIIQQYDSGIRTFELRKQILTAIEHFSNKKYTEPEAEDLDDAPDNEECWKSAIEWLKRHGKNA